MTSLIGLPQHCTEILKRQQNIISCTPICTVKLVHKEQTGLILPRCSQKPDNRREQLPCIHVTVFPPTGLLTERFWCKFRISFKSHKIASKTCRPKTGIFDLQMTFTFPGLISYIPNARIEGVYLTGKSSLKFILKINRSVKSSWHSPLGFGTPVSNVVPLGLPRYNANIVVVFLIVVYRERRRPRRSKSREKRSKSRDRRSRSRDRSRDKSKERKRTASPERSPSKEKKPSKQKSEATEKDEEKDEKSREESEERTEKRRSKDKEKARDKESEKERDRERRKEKERQREKEREREREKREKEREREREKREREVKEREREREKERERDRDRDRRRSRSHSMSPSPKR